MGRERPETVRERKKKKWRECYSSTQWLMGSIHFGINESCVAQSEILSGLSNARDDLRNQKTEEHTSVDLYWIFHKVKLNKDKSENENFIERFLTVT